MANLQTFERSEYQQVKSDLHRKILDRLNLEKLGRTPSETAREEVLILIRNSVNSEAVDLAREHGFEKVRALSRMSLSITADGPRLDNRDGLVFAAAGFEYG